MSNSESTDDSQATKVASKCNDSIVKDKQAAVKRSISTPQSPLKIQQQKREEAFGRNVSIELCQSKSPMD